MRKGEKDKEKGEESRRAEWGFLLSSLLYIIVGGERLKLPCQSLRTVCYFFGAVTLLYGLIRIILYFVQKKDGFLFHANIVVGIVLSGIGIFLLLTPEVVISIIPFIIGFFILFHSIVKIQSALELRRVHYEKWWGMLLLSVVTALLGGFVIYNPFKTVSMMVRAIGIVLMADGAMSLVSIFFTAHTVKKMTKIVDEATGTVEEAETEVIDNEEIR